MNVKGSRTYVQANKFSTLIGKLVNFHFITFKDGINFAVTTIYDFLKFIIGVTFGFCVAVRIFRMSLKLTERSAILEISAFLMGKFQTIHPTTVMLQFFLFRFEHYKIVSHLFWIDKKVKKL
jgi:hypothetical protein